MSTRTTRPGAACAPADRAVGSTQADTTATIPAPERETRPRGAHLI